jgi:hypothetical protein
MDPLSDSDDTGRQSESWVQIGEIRSVTKNFFPKSAKTRALAKIAALISPILDSSSTGPYSVVARG